MPKIIVTMWTTLDGFVAGPDDEMNWVRVDDAMMVYEQELVEAADVLLLGRITFGDFAGHWPRLAGEPVALSGDAPSVDDLQRAYARRLDIMKKIVVSESGNVPAWGNAETLSVIDKMGVGRLKRASDGDIVVYGSLSVVRALSKLELVDEYHLLLHPVALGAGKPLFDKPASLKLKSAEAFQSGVVLAKYAAG